MKKLLTIALLFIATYSYSQSNFHVLQASGADSTQSIIRLQQRVDNIELNLKNSHKQFRKGTILIFTGLLVSTVGIATGGDSAPVFAGIGGGLTLIGGLVHIISHNHIGYAGGWKKK